MALRLEAFERNLRVAVGDITGPEAAKRLAAFARDQLRDAIASGEGGERYERFVNGREGAPEESVTLPGPIVYRFSYLDEVIVYALDFLRARSPVRGGHYRDRHLVMVNGAVVGSSAEPEALAKVGFLPGAEVVIVNDVPYARKVQVGAMRMSVPPGIYDDAYKAVRRRYGEFVSVGMTFVTLSDGYRLKRDGGRRGSRKGDPLTYPALSLSLLR